MLCLFEAQGFCLRQALFFQKEKTVNIGRLSENMGLWGSYQDTEADRKA